MTRLKVLLNVYGIFFPQKKLKGKARWQKITSVKINSYHASAGQKEGFLRLLKLRKHAWQVCNLDTFTIVFLLCSYPLCLNDLNN